MTGDAEPAWTSGVPCPHGPGNRAFWAGRLCHGPEPPLGPVRWQCSARGDEGTISSWQDAPYALPRRTPSLLGQVREVVLSGEVTAALRGTPLLEAEVERVVYGMRADGRRIVRRPPDRPGNNRRGPSRS